VVHGITFKVNSYPANQEIRPLSRNPNLHLNSQKPINWIQSTTHPTSQGSILILYSYLSQGSQVVSSHPAP